MIKMLVMDVDGTLTPGYLFMTEQGEEMKVFHSQDGYGIKNVLPQYGIRPAIITGRKSRITELRCEELGIKDLVQGKPIGKAEALKELADKYALSMEEIAYIGDDVNDIECMQICGVSGCPENALDDVKEVADYICKREGGHGAVREFIEKIIIKNKKREVE